MAMLNRRAITPRPPHTFVSKPAAATSVPKTLAVSHGPTEPMSDSTPAPIVRTANSGKPAPGGWRLSGTP